MADLTHAQRKTLTRWRLVLGKAAEEHGIGLGDDEKMQRIEALVGFLFGTPGGKQKPGDRTGGHPRPAICPATGQPAFADDRRAHHRFL